MYNEKECLRGLTKLLKKTEEAIIEKAVTEKMNLDTLIRFKRETKILKREASFNVLYVLIIELKLENEYNKKLEWERYIKDRTTGRR